jgi:hypothetical protein
MSRDLFKLDAGESAFFKRELEYVKSKSYDTQYKQLKGLLLIPVSTEAGEGATEITWRKYTGVGFAKIIADYAKDFPKVDVYGEEVTSKVKGIGASYGYSIEDIRRSQMTGKRLDQRRADMAKRAIDEKINSIALSGDSASGLNGFINASGITEYTVLADGTGSCKLWSAKTADQIVRDITGLVSAVMVPTAGKEVPDTLVLPLTQYNLIANTRMGSYNDTTILQYVLKNSPAIKQIEWLSELAGAGASGTNRMMVYAKDPMKLTLEIPRPFEQFEAQQQGMEFQIPCHAKCGGVLIYYPLSVAYGDGI